MSKRSGRGKRQSQKYDEEYYQQEQLSDTPSAQAKTTPAFKLDRATPSGRKPRAPRQSLITQSTEQKEDYHQTDDQHQSATPFEQDDDDNFEDDGASPERLYSGSGRKSANGKRLRQENGLVELTKKFIDLIKKAPEQCVDLNEAVGKLEVQKRRIYDITNVLEGIGLIAKYKKNKIRWAGNDHVRKQHHQALFANKRIKRVEEDNELAQETLRLK